MSLGAARAASSRQYQLLNTGNITSMGTQSYTIPAGTYYLIIEMWGGGGGGGAGKSVAGRGGNIHQGGQGGGGGGYNHQQHQPYGKGNGKNKDDKHRNNKSDKKGGNLNPGSKLIVEAMGGKICFESLLGRCGKHHGWCKKYKGNWHLSKDELSSQVYTNSIQPNAGKYFANVPYNNLHFAAK